MIVLLTDITQETLPLWSIKPGGIETWVYPPFRVYVGPSLMELFFCMTVNRLQPTADPLITAYKNLQRTPKHVTYLLRIINTGL